MATDDPNADPRNLAYETETVSTVAGDVEAVVVYPELVVIAARKPDGHVYEHKFRKGTRVLGLEDGSLFIPANGRKLWGFR